MNKTNIHEFVRLAMENNEFSLQPWQEEFIKSLDQTRRIFTYRTRAFSDELIWQIQLEAFRTFWLKGESTVMFSPRFCDVRRPVMIIDELWQLREVLAERDEQWYQQNYLNPWIPPDDEDPHI